MNDMVRRHRILSGVGAAMTLLAVAGLGAGCGSSDQAAAPVVSVSAGAPAAVSGTATLTFASGSADADDPLTLQTGEYEEVSPSTGESAAFSPTSGGIEACLTSTADCQVTATLGDPTGENPTAWFTERAAVAVNAGTSTAKMPSNLKWAGTIEMFPQNGYTQDYDSNYNLDMVIGLDADGSWWLGSDKLADDVNAGTWRVETKRPYHGIWSPGSVVWFGVKDKSHFVVCTNDELAGDISKCA